MDTQPPPCCPYGHGLMAADARAEGLHAAEYGDWWACTYRRCTAELLTPSLLLKLTASQPLTRIRAAV